MNRDEMKLIVDDLMEACVTLREARTSLWEDWETDHDEVLQQLTHAHDRLYRALLNMYAQELARHLEYENIKKEET